MLYSGISLLKIVVNITRFTSIIILCAGNLPSPKM